MTKWGSGELAECEGEGRTCGLEKGWSDRKPGPRPTRDMSGREDGRPPVVSGGKTARRTVAGLVILTSGEESSSSTVVSHAPFILFRTTLGPFSPSVPSPLSPLAERSTFGLLLGWSSSGSLSAQPRSEKEERGLEVRWGCCLTAGEERGRGLGEREIWNSNWKKTQNGSAGSW